MSTSKIVGGIIGVLVAIIVVAVVAIPIVNDTTSSIINDDNANLEAGISYDVDLSATGSYTVEYSSGKLTINDVEVNVPSGSSIPVIVTDTYSAWLNNGVLMGGVKATSSTSSLNSVTFNNGSYDADPTAGSNATGTYTSIYFALNENNKGTYGIGTPGADSPIYANNSSKIFLSQNGSNYASATVPTSGTTIQTENVWSTYSSGTSLTFTITAGEDYATITGTSNSAMVIAPFEYLANADNATNANLLNIIPMLMLIGIVMLAVAMLAYKGRDY